MQLSWDDYDTDTEETAGVIADLAVRDLAVREGAEPAAAPVEPGNAGLDMALAVEPAVPEPPPFVAPPLARGSGDPGARRRRVRGRGAPARGRPRGAGGRVPRSRRPRRGARAGPRGRGEPRARDGRPEGDDQLPGGPQPARALQVRLGVAEVPGRLRQPLDAAGNQHDRGHHAVEVRGRPDSGRAQDRQAQPRLLLDRRLAGGEQPGARDLSPDHQPRVPPVHPAPGLRGGHPHARLPVLHRVPRHGRGRDLQHVPGSGIRRSQGSLGAPVHARPRGPDVQHGHAAERPDAAREPDRVLLRAGEASSSTAASRRSSRWAAATR